MTSQQVIEFFRGRGPYTHELITERLAEARDSARHVSDLGGILILYRNGEYELDGMMA